MSENPRIWKRTIVDGEPIVLADYLTGPDNLTVLTNATSGQPGVSTIDIAVYKRGSSAALYTITLTPGGAIWGATMQATPLIGSGYSEDPRGVNFLYLLQGDAVLAALEGCTVVLVEAAVHRTGKTPASTGTPWGTVMHRTEVTILARQSA